MQAKRGGTELWQVCYKTVAYVTYVRTYLVTEATVTVLHNTTSEAIAIGLSVTEYSISENVWTLKSKFHKTFSLSHLDFISNEKIISL